MKYPKTICTFMLLSFFATLVPMQKKGKKTSRHFTQKQKQDFLFNAIDSAYSPTTYKKHKKVRSNHENWLIYSIDQNNISIVDQLLNQPNNRPRKSTVKKIILWLEKTRDHREQCTNTNTLTPIEILIKNYIKKSKIKPHVHNVYANNKLRDSPRDKDWI